MENIFVEKVQIEGGFLDGLDVSLKKGLNTIIGARGTGKSTFVELIRYCLDVRGNSVESNNKSISHAKSVLKDGQVIVTLSNGVDSFRYSRTADSETIPAIGRDFKLPLMFSQTEIENVGLTSHGRLKLIDDFLVGLEIITQQENAEIAIVEAYASEMISLSSNVSDVEDKLLALPSLLHQLHELESEEKKISNISDLAKLKSDELKVLSDVYIKTNTAIQRNNELFKRIMELHSYTANYINKNHELKSWMTTNEVNSSILLQEVSEIEILIELTSTKLINLSEITSKDTQELQSSLNKIAQKGQELRSEVDKIQQGAGELARRRQTLQQSISTLKNIQKDNLEKERRILDLKKRRDQSLSNLESLRKKRTDMRVGKCHELCQKLKPKIKINVEVSSRLDAYQQVLINSLKGSNIKYNDLAPIISESIPPMELINIIESNDVDGFTTLVSISKDRAARVINSLKNSVDKIATVRLDEEIRLELLDGSEYKDFSALSTGQRCTVILPIILEHTDRILIVDQPEDHIDNAFIVETLISSIVRRAGKGQIIVTSHNANVPVLGNAEEVIHLNSDGTRGFVVAEGGLDKIEIVNAISSVMEGGREAFNRRADFYGR